MLEKKSIPEKLENLTNGYSILLSDLIFARNNAKVISPYVREVLDHLGMSDIKTELLPNEHYLMVGDIEVVIQSRLGFIHSFLAHYKQGPVNASGFAIPEQKKAIIREGPLEKVMYVTGHELGHLFAPEPGEVGALDKEEAKAYAFQYAWCRAIQEHNIANLGNKIMEDFSKTPGSPVHFVAQYFVMSFIKSGYDPLELYWAIAKGTTITHPSLCRILQGE